jgi:hypothetical protein
LIVYVETNFVLELAYLRSTSENCQGLIALAQQGKISLVVPAFALIEARLAWRRNVKRRNRLHAEVRNELGELARSRPLIDIGAQSQGFVAALIDTAEQDRGRLEAAVEILLGVAVVVPTEPAVIMQALEAERRLDLSPQDAVIFATVLNHADVTGGPKLFVTQNANDFRVPLIEDELASHGCKLLVTFDDAEAYVHSKIAT